MKKEKEQEVNGESKKEDRYYFDERDYLVLKNEEKQ